jgi:hypothetical protein
MINRNIDVITVCSTLGDFFLWHYVNKSKELIDVLLSPPLKLMTTGLANGMQNIVTLPILGY